MGVKSIVLIIVSLCVLSCLTKNNQTENEIVESREFAGKFLEQGRTFVRNSLKRLTVLLPAVFFKLGIAFTMLVLVTIVSVNNGFIGFLLLVVGLSSVLARFQEARRSPVMPYVNALPMSTPYLQAKYIQDWARKGKTVNVEVKDPTPIVTNSYDEQFNYPQLSTYRRQNFLSA